MKLENFTVSRNVIFPQQQFVIQQHPPGKDTIGLPPAIPTSEGELEAIDPRVQQNMNQLLLEIQNQIASQQVFQIQQQLMSVSEDENQTPSSSTTTMDQPPPSYNVAVALSNGTSTSQQGIPGQVILQALPVTCGDTITIHTQPVDSTSGSATDPGLQMNPRTGSQVSTDDRSQVSSAQSFLVSIPDIIEVDSLEQDSLPDVIEIAESETFTDQLTEALQSRTGQSHLGAESPEVRLLSDLESTISSITPAAPTRSTASILRKKPRNTSSSSSNATSFTRSTMRTACDPPVSMRTALPTSSAQIQSPSTFRPVSQLPGDMLMPSEPLRALSSTNQNLILQSIPVTATIRKSNTQSS